MAFEPLQYTKSWVNAQDFPTYEPNEAQVRADLQLLHDEARDGLNRLVAALNDPTAAARLPFQPQDGLTAENIQEAVLQTYAAVRDAAAGLLVDGSVTKAKLAAELLRRTYGGRVWIAMDEPGAAQNPHSDFPLGQLWLRPAFAVDNLALDQWSLSGCTAQKTEDGWLLTADGTLDVVSAAQTLTGIGEAGQQVQVSLRASELDDHLSALTLYLNGTAQDLTAGGGVFGAALDQNGSLELLVKAQWPYAEADAAWKLTHLAVVNGAQICAGLEGCEPLADWAGLVERLVPFRQVRFPRTLFVQTASGVWETVDQEVLPVARGGTGLEEVLPGQLLCGGLEALETVAAAEQENSLLLWQDGMPRWQTKELAAGDLGFLRMAAGTYEGTGTAGSVTLPVTPKLLHLWPRSGPDASGVLLGRSIADNPLTLGNGAKAAELQVVYTDAGTAYKTVFAALEADRLVFSSEDGAPTGLGNRSGVAYSWVAVY